MKRRALTRAETRVHRAHKTFQNPELGSVNIFLHLLASNRDQQRLGKVEVKISTDGARTNSNKLTS